jgi:hypothetical protein
VPALLERVHAQPQVVHCVLQKGGGSHPGLTWRRRSGTHMCHDSCHDLQECASPTPEVSTRARCHRVWKACMEGVRECLHTRLLWHRPAGRAPWARDERLHAAPRGVREPPSGRLPRTLAHARPLSLANTKHKGL